MIKLFLLVICVNPVSCHSRQWWWLWASCISVTSHTGPDSMWREGLPLSQPSTSSVMVSHLSPHWAPQNILIKANGFGASPEGTMSVNNSIEASDDFTTVLSDWLISYYQHHWRLQRYYFFTAIKSKHHKQIVDVYIKILNEREKHFIWQSENPS